MLQVWQPDNLFHELLKVKGALLQKLYVLRITEEAALGELGDVQTWQPQHKALSEYLKFAKFALYLEVTFGIKRSHIEKDLAIALKWVANEHVDQSLLIGSHECGIKKHAILLIYLARRRTLLQLINELLVRWCLRWLSSIWVHMHPASADTVLVDWHVGGLGTYLLFLVFFFFALVRYLVFVVIDDLLSFLNDLLRTGCIFL